MNTKKYAIALIVTLLTLLPMQSQAQAATPIQKQASSVSGSFTFGFQDTYLAGRVSKPLIIGPNMWADFTFEWPSGIVVSYAQYEALDKTEALYRGSSEVNEALLSIAYKWKWHETNFRFQSTLINLHPHGQWFDNDRLAIELYASRQLKFECDRGLFRGKHTLTPELRLGWFSFWNEISSGVPFAIPALQHAWEEPFGIPHATLRSRIAIEADNGFRRNDPGAFWQFETGLQWKLRKNVTLTLPGWKWIEPFSHDRDDGRGNGSDTFFTSLTLRF